jgi:hypothetical protein
MLRNRAGTAPNGTQPKAYTVPFRNILERAAFLPQKGR